ncbi:MAG: Uracil DNA glycosylase superfamily protein [Lentisphaerae bacterium ADurb.Bin242]|nr:MAG: Uracil DNA glycosylase superfamily protein [Lentisphaerae bacterium ADurb.Bin242]
MAEKNLLDEITDCLKDELLREPRAAVPDPVLRDFYTDYPRPPKKEAAQPSAAVREQVPEKPRTVPGTEEKKVSPPPPAERVLFSDPAASMGWEELAQTVAECRKCRLCETRTNTVFGEGDTRAPLLFFGEGPGADEDMQGRPFVGRAGELLTRMINAMQFQRSEVYIANTVKCRPPGNRNPEPDETEACRPYAERQIELLSPEVIVVLGAVPFRFLFPNVYGGIRSQRGRWMEYRGIRVMPTYHPAYLLRNPAAKADVWKDLQEVMAVFGKKRVPGRRA